MLLSGPDKQAVKEFVQVVLGCACPKEVFSNIEIEDTPASFADLSEGLLILIGNKLLVYLIQTNDGMSLVNKMQNIFNRGRELRDKKGCNRFRLVISDQRKNTSQSQLYQKFESIEKPDNRLHLHVIESKQLPKLDRF